MKYAQDLKKPKKRWFSCCRANPEPEADIDPDSLPPTSSPVWFSSFADQTNPHNEVTIRDAVCASGSAPTYFPCHRFQDGAGNWHAYIDGGMTGQNNPEATAYTMGRYLGETRLQPNEKDGEESYYVLSVGTGAEPLYYDADDYNNRGLLRLIHLIINLTLNMPSQTATSTLALNLEKNTARFNPRLLRPIDLADTSPASLATMKRISDAYIAKNEQKLDETAQLLWAAYSAKTAASQSSPLMEDHEYMDA